MLLLQGGQILRAGICRAGRCGEFCFDGVQRHDAPHARDDTGETGGVEGEMNGRTGD